MNKTEKAIQALREVMLEDMMYARSWHDNISMLMQDNGVPREDAESDASGFMIRVFDIDTLNMKV